MKAKIVESTESKSNTNWDKVQVMKYGEIRVLTTGIHTKEHFCAIDLRIGSYHDSFLKSYYTPMLPGEKITVEFQND